MNTIIKVIDRLFTKLEINNLSSSHKYRAACLIIEMHFVKVALF